MTDGEFGGSDDAAPGDDVLQVVERSDGVTARGVAGALGIGTEEAKERLRSLQASGEIEEVNGVWLVPERAGADDPYVF
jgi:predicted ArsR family transcriptional regulator